MKTVLPFLAAAVLGVAPAAPLSANAATNAATTTTSSAASSASASATTTAPAASGPQQALRFTAGAELWTVPAPVLQQFVADGRLRDQRLQRLVSVSGWPSADLRAALARAYSVDLVALARFLDSAEGLAFLQQQSRAYRPLPASRPPADLRVQALRAAILAEARTGRLTALGILQRLPVPLVLDLAGPAPLRCSALPCTDPQQCSSVFSWIAFLPACLQAASTSLAASR